MKKLKLKLTTTEKINLLKYGSLKIQRGIFPIIIELDDYDGGCEITIINPYDTEQLEEELSSFVIHFNEKKSVKKGWK